MDDFGGMLFALATIAIMVMVMIWVPYALISLLRQRPRSTARDIADERYARGELTEQEYRQIRNTLES